MKDIPMFNVNEFDVAEFDRILACGLSRGLGQRGQQVCIEAAVCQVLGLHHVDDPGCVSDAVRSFKITLNDAMWSSPQSRAAGLRDLGLAQLGSKGVVDDVDFAKRISKKTIQVLIPSLFRELFPQNKKLLAAADRCEEEGIAEVARSAAEAESEFAAAYAAKVVEYAALRAEAYAAKVAEYAAVRAAYAAKVAEYAAVRAAYAAVEAAVEAERAAAKRAKRDKYLILSAQLALDALRELDSPGIALL